MKYLLPFLLLLTGCFHTTWNAPSPIEKPQHTPTQIASGNDTINSWTCVVSDVNPTLVWIECKFVNVSHFVAAPSDSGSKHNSCIGVYFFENESGKVVVGKLGVCSGPIGIGETNTQYVAFRELHRVYLNASCGESLEKCVMLAANVNESSEK